MDYTIFYKENFNHVGFDFGETYDIFISGYDNCERTTSVFDGVTAKRKVWFIFPQYGITVTDYPGAELFTSAFFKEDEFILDFFSKSGVALKGRICIDITGFLRPHLIFLVKYLNVMGVKNIDFLYSEPQLYNQAEDTIFSESIDEVRIIEGCGASRYEPKTENDILILSAGYDDELITAVVQEKSKIKRKYNILGFPSMQPDMYQESVLKVHHTRESAGNMKSKFAPAYDPFITAQVIEQIIRENPDHSNIYLSPLSTKPQALGMIIFYLWNYLHKPVNIIFPYSNSYKDSTATGVKKTWRYIVELP